MHQQHFDNGEYRFERNANDYNFFAVIPGPDESSFAGLAAKIFNTAVDGLAIREELETKGELHLVRFEVEGSQVIVKVSYEQGAVRLSFNVMDKAPPHIVKTIANWTFIRHPQEHNPIVVIHDENYNPHDILEDGTELIHIGTYGVQLASLWFITSNRGSRWDLEDEFKKRFGYKPGLIAIYRLISKDD